MKYIALIVCCIAFFCSKAQETKDSTKVEERLFELSFGQSIFFISESKVVDIRNEAAVVIPTSAILFYTELRPERKLRMPVFLNLPTESKQFLIDSIVVNEKSSATFGIGLEYRLGKIPVSTGTLMEFEAGAVANSAISKDNKLLVAPVVTGRMKLIKNRNFVMYLGGIYSVGVDTWGLIYGTGFMF